MNPLIKPKHTTTSVLLVALMPICFAIPPIAKAVVPAPDGGYPGGNTAEGQAALLSLSTGTFNTAVGFLSLRSNTEGNFNTAMGAGTLLSNAGSNNTATGAAALLSNTTGSNNSRFGSTALALNTSGSLNTAIGAQALSSNTAGFENTAIGVGALGSSTGTGHIAVGFGAGGNVTTANNVICIGNNIVGANVNNTCFISGIRGMTTIHNDAMPVLIDSFGQLGTMSSSRRFKKEIKPMDKVSEALLALKPVTFNYKSDNSNRPEFGLIAEDVAKINPDLVVRDENGEIYTVRYDAVNAMLLNEFLKEHRKVQELEATVAQQRKELETTITELKQEMKNFVIHAHDQEAQIQKVGAEVEVNASETGTVAQK